MRLYHLHTLPGFLYPIHNPLAVNGLGVNFFKITVYKWHYIWYNVYMKKGNDMSSVKWVATDAKETKEIPVAREPFTRSLEDGVDIVVNLIEENYITWSGLKPIDYGPEWEKSEVIKERMSYEFVKGIDYKKGSKYIKIITGTSVWGFIVNSKTDSKFKYGDILKAAGWASPARNFARGNVIEDSVEELRNNSVRWTGVRY